MRRGYPADCLEGGRGRASGAPVLGPPGTHLRALPGKCPRP